MSLEYWQDCAVLLYCFHLLAEPIDDTALAVAPVSLLLVLGQNLLRTVGQAVGIAVRSSCAVVETGSIDSAASEEWAFPILLASYLCLAS
jgi:hypothetical protein